MHFGEIKLASYEIRGKSIRAIISLPDGKKKSATFDTKAEAKAWAEEQEHRKLLGKLTSARNLTVGDLFKAYLPVAEKTDSGRENALRLMKWLNDPISQIALESIITHDIDQWIIRRSEETHAVTGTRITAATVNRELNLMSGAFTWAVKTRKWLQTNPCHGAMRPAKARGRNRKALTPQEIKAICIAGGYSREQPPETMTAKVCACFLLALETGLRSGEILRLKPDDYRKDLRIVHVRAAEQGGRKAARSGRNHNDPSRDVPLTKRAIELLDQLLETMPTDQKPQERLANPPYIVGMNDSQRDALWRKVRDRAGVNDLHYHDTKHEAATKLSKFMDVLALSHAIGTKDIRLLRDTYYINDAQRIAKQLPDSLSV